MKVKYKRGTYEIVNNEMTWVNREYIGEVIATVAISDSAMFVLKDKEGQITTVRCVECTVINKLEEVLK